MTGYRLRPKAATDLEAIGDFIAQHDPERASSFVGELLEFCTQISERPRAYPRRDDLAVGIRQAVYGRYLIFYRIEDGETILVTRIVHSARRLDDLI